MSDPEQKNTVFELVRWVLYLPVAFFASLIPAAIGFFIAGKTGLSEWSGFLIFGLFFAPSFLLVALYMAPRLNPFTKWSIVVSLFLFGFVHFLAGYISKIKGFDDSIIVLGYTGVAPFIISVIIAFIPLQKWMILKKVN